MEPDLLPAVRLLPELVPQPVCAACGRHDYRTVETPVFQRASFADRHIARGYEFTSQIFVSEHFKRLVEGRAWAGVAFAEIAVV